MEENTVNLSSLTRGMSSLRRTFREVSKGTRETAQILLALKKAMDQTGKTGTKLARSLASFDQLNRLSSPGSALGQVTELTESYRELRAELLKPITLLSLDNMPDQISGVNDALVLLGDSILRGTVDLSRYEFLWDAITVTMGLTGDALGGVQEKTVTLREAMEFVRQTAGHFADSMGVSARATQGLQGQMTELGIGGLSAFTTIQSCWSTFANWFSGNVGSPIQTSISGMFTGMPVQAQQAWGATTQVFSQTAGFFESTFSNAWSRVKSVFSNSGPVFEGIKSGVLEGFRVRVNGLIDGINVIIPESFNGITTAINKLRTIRIGGTLPFASIAFNPYVPKIPHLAKGAVLPANKPFMAVVGDQRHGTNVEAPLETITEAVRLAMEELQEGNLAGHRATVELLGRILEAVRTVHITDGDIAAANHRYEQKQAIMYGV